MNISSNIENSFYPEVYPVKTPANNDLNLCLVKKNGLARYALAVFKFDKNLDLNIQIANARTIVRKQTKALWLVKEVGAYIVFVCDELPNLNASQLEIDRTGFHAVIIQGVHLISKSGEHLYNHTKWLNKSFGGTESIAKRLENCAI